MTDISDLFAESGLPDNLDDITTPKPEPQPLGDEQGPGAEFGKVKNQLAVNTTKTGVYPRPNEANYYLFIKHHGALSGRFRMNFFTNEIEVSRPLRAKPGKHEGYPRSLKDDDVTDVCMFLTAVDHSGRYIKGGNFNSVGQSTVLSVITKVARENGYDPLVDAMNDLPEWDGVTRLDMFLHRVWGVEQNDYHAFVGRVMLMGQVARALNPGVKFDFCAILGGKQGLGKSRFCRALAGKPDWFTDSLGNLGGKESFQAIQGVWIVELAELASMRKAEVENVKAFISAQSDRFRFPYQRTFVTVQRRIVMWGTTNAENYLTDRSGARRFLPIKCEKPVNMEYLRANREQLLAEARVYVERGDPLFVKQDDPLAAVLKEKQDEQGAEYIHGKKWAEYLDKIKPGAFMSAPEILYGSMEMHADRVTHTIKIELGAFIRDHCPQWKKTRKRVSGVLCNGWEKMKKKTGSDGDEYFE